MDLPYGVYIGADGTETLFDRNYTPLYTRDPDGKNVRRASGWIEHTKQRWFYDDRCTPKHNKKSAQRCQAAMTAFVHGKPITSYLV